MSVDPLRALHWRISSKLDDIRAMFDRPDEARLTLVVRMPWLDDGGVLIGDDESDKAIEEIRRLETKAALQTGEPPHARPE